MTDLFVVARCGETGSAAVLYQINSEAIEIIGYESKGEGLSMGPHWKNKGQF